MSENREHPEDSRSQAPQDRQEDCVEASGGVNASRRRFTRAALTSAPVLYALAHRPALGAGACHSPSGYHSVNTSGPDQSYTCDGGTPEYWRVHPGEWPSPYEPGTCADDSDQLTAAQQTDDGVSNLDDSSGGQLLGGASVNGMADGGCMEYMDDGTPFFSVFEFQPHFAVDDPESLTLMQVLWLEGSEDPNGLGRHLAASLLNVARGWAPPLNESLLQKMWSDGATGNGFVHTGGEDGWGPQEIVEYLQSTMYRD